MRKVKDVLETVELIEKGILDNEVESILPGIIGNGLYLDTDIDEFRGARKALLWVVEKAERKKKDTKGNKTLEEFKIKNPIVRIK